MLKLTMTTLCVATTRHRHTERTQWKAKSLYLPVTHLRGGRGWEQKINQGMQHKIIMPGLCGRAINLHGPARAFGPPRDRKRDCWPALSQV